MISLNGQWILRGKDADGLDVCVPATVPGCVHTDFLKNGLIGDMFYRDNSRFCQFIENNDYTYELRFQVSEIKDNAYLEFDALDTYCDIFLNGKLIAHTENMHISYAFNVDGVLARGENVLTVKFYSPVNAVKDKPLLKGAFTRERMHTRRIQCTYSWDWVDRFVTMGIFRDVRLVFRENNEIDNFYIYTKDINPFSAQLRLDISIRDYVSTEDKLEFSIFSPSGKPVYTKSRALVKDRFIEYINITSPELWYPSGYGEQPLYKLVISTPSSTKELLFGIRKLTVLEIEDEIDSEYWRIARELKEEAHLAPKDLNERSACFTVLVNGIKIFAKGGNWVPCEPFPSDEAPEKITKLLLAGKEAGVNMLRVWGGGIFEQDHFYNECDRLGILVTQDFLMACGEYPEKEEWFIDALRKEAEHAALRLRNHTCLAWWSGDNENAVLGHEDTDDYLGFPSATYGLEPVISQLDPDRYFFASSPYGGKPYSSFTRGTTHNTYFLWNMFTYLRSSDLSDYRKYFATYLTRFNAEQAALGMPFVSTLKRFMTKEDIFGEDTSISEYHTKNNPALNPSLYQYVDMFAQKLFGDFKDGCDRVRKMQLLHCEWVRLSLELARRHKWYSSGIIYWMFNDCWPAANGWSLIDYYAMPKPAYYVFKRCAKPVICSISEKDNVLQVRISNDSLEKAQGHGKLYLYDFRNDKNIFDIDFDFNVDLNASGVAFTCDYSMIPFSSSTVLLCDVECEINSDRAFFIPVRYKDIDFNYNCVKIVEENNEFITVEADDFTPFALIDVPYYLEENCFAIKKGERKRIKKLF